MDVRLPDGTIIRNVPEGITQGELARRVGKLEGGVEGLVEGAEAVGDLLTPQITAPPAIPQPVGIPQEPQPAIGGGEAFSRGMMTQFLSNLGQIPEELLQAAMPQPESPSLIPGPLEALSAITSAITGGAVDPAAAAPQAREQLEGSMTGENILGAIGGAAGGVMAGDPATIPERIDLAQQREAERSALAQEQAPIATTAGEIAGDVATLLTGRGGARGLVRRARGTPQAVAAANQVLTQAAPQINRAAQTVLNRSLQSFGRSVARSAGRATETGIEGALLTALQGASPEDIAQVGGGGVASQMAGDALLRTFRRFASNNRLLNAIAIGTVASLGLQQLTPGGLDRVLPTFEDVNQNAFLSMLIGGVGGAALGGRVPNNFAGPAMAELINVGRRGVLISALQSIARDPVRTAPVIERFSQDPDFFGPRARDLLTRALNSESIDVSNTIDRLMKNREFRQKFETLER